MSETIEQLQERIRVLTGLRDGTISVYGNDHGKTGTYYCSFCGKDQREVKKLIAGPAVMICDECVDLCREIIGTEQSRDEEKAANVSRGTEEPRWTIEKLAALNEDEFLRVLTDLIECRAEGIKP